MRDWPPKDWRAILALLGSIAGAAALTGLLALLAWFLLPAKGWSAGSEPDRISTIRWIALICAPAVLLVLTGLGFAINRRALRGRWGDKSLDWEGGDDAPEKEG